VAGHLTIFLTRTRGRFWSIRPAKILWIAVLGTQIVATLIAVYGLFMTPLGWGWAGFVWGYALLWFLVNDNVKLLAYRIFDPAKAAAKPEGKAGEPKPEAKVDPKTQSKPESEAKADAKPDAKPEVKTETKTEPNPEVKAVEPKPEVKTSEPKPEVKVEPQPEAEAKSKTPSDLTPGLVKRVHKLYEELGREDVQAVQDWEKAERETRKDEAKAEHKPDKKD
jgi:H+-transporting ATPase